MLALQVALVLALLLVCAFTPGFFFVRRLPWSPMEKLCGSIGLSLLLLYLVSWEYYLDALESGIATRPDRRPTRTFTFIQLGGCTNEASQCPGSSD